MAVVRKTKKEDIMAKQVEIYILVGYQIEYILFDNCIYLKGL